MLLHRLQTQRMWNFEAEIHTLPILEFKTLNLKAYGFSHVTYGLFINHVNIIPNVVIENK